MNVRAIAFDLDDTLLRVDRTISEYTVKVLKRASEQGICLIPASGRAQPSMAPYVDRLGVCDYYIASNGAEVWTSNHTILSQTLLEPDQIR